MKIVLTETELKEALILWGSQKGIKLPNDIKIKVRRKAKNENLTSVVIETN